MSEKEEAANNIPPAQDFYEVEEILDKRLTSNGMMYQIKWKNYPNEKDYTWEPIHHLVEVADLVKEFNKKFEEKKKQAKKQKKVKDSNRKKKRSLNVSKRSFSEQSEVNQSLRIESSFRQVQRERKTINSIQRQDESDKLSYESKTSEEESPINTSSRDSKRFNNFEAFSADKQVQKNISQLQQYLQTNNVKLGRVHQHFLLDDCLYFHVDIVRDNLIYARTFENLQDLKKLHRNELVSYMQSWTIQHLHHKTLAQTDQIKDTIEYWRQKM